MMRNMQFAGCMSINIIVLILAVVFPALALVAFVASALTCIILSSKLRSTRCIAHISSPDLKYTDYE